MSRHEITLKVNGKTHCLTVDSNELLLNVLRERLYLTGSKYGCGIAECGACTVLVNGQSMLACLIPAVSADGWDITTVEGLADGDQLNPVQQAFIDNNRHPMRVLYPRHGGHRHRASDGESAA